jgi:hypothetical protein
MAHSHGRRREVFDGLMGSRRMPVARSMPDYSWRLASVSHVANFGFAMRSEPGPDATAQRRPMGRAEDERNVAKMIARREPTGDRKRP